MKFLMQLVIEKVHLSSGCYRAILDLKVSRFLIPLFTTLKFIFVVFISTPFCYISLPHSVLLLWTYTVTWFDEKKVCSYLSKHLCITSPNTCASEAGDGKWGSGIIKTIPFGAMALFDISSFITREPL